ncbi:MAG TPA: chemotaxis protein CheW [Kofleriaceae bacterium]|nr:chemotaxis protein CheW [Kofleriaceae bacterium]
MSDARDPNGVKPGDLGCWRMIGVGGDASCPELRTVVHCRNCPVYTGAGRALFERPSPPEYVDEWTTFLAQAKVRAVPRTLAVLVFRIGDEWLGLDTASVVEIADTRPVHRIPHRAGPVLGGLVNIRGQLLLFVSLHGLLKIDPGQSGGSERFVVVSQGDASWVFRADSVEGVQRFAPSDVARVPVTVAHGAASLSQGLLPFGERRVGYLDSAALFATLRKAVG